MSVSLLSEKIEQIIWFVNIHLIMYIQYMECKEHNKWLNKEYL